MSPLTIPARIALAASLLTAIAASVPPARAQDAAAGQTVFKQQCGTCHSAKAGQNGVGPSLSGIVGSKPAAVPGFYFSAANKAADLIWDAPTLDRYLTSPQAVVPHTTMTYAGLKDPAKRADVIAYLTTLR